MTLTFTHLRHLVASLALASMVSTMKADTTTSKTVFDFESATNPPRWEVVNDDVMGGVSDSEFQVLTGTGAVFSGTVRLENNGGFASVRSPKVREDLAGHKAIILRVRGDGRRYKFTVRTEAATNTPLHQCSFSTRPGEWEEHRLMMRDFIPTFRGRVLTGVPPLDPARIHSIGLLISDKQAGPFRLEIAWIKSL